MGCRYEEEIYNKEGKVDKCGCPNCPYKNLVECKEGDQNHENED
jgi:hypothetical protein